MTTKWLAGAHVRDLSTHGIGNGPFHVFKGVVLHVNVDEHGTPTSFWGPGNSGQVCPNFQVFKDGSIDQMLPFDWQPWCQVDGNFNYAAIETAGMPNEPLTNAQMQSIAKILGVYHSEMNMQLQIANVPGQAGFGVHCMGGASWGGHSCPGTIRANQRQAILDLVTAEGDDVSAADVWTAPIRDKYVPDSKGNPQDVRAGVLLINAHRYAYLAANEQAKFQVEIDKRLTEIETQIAAILEAVKK